MENAILNLPAGQEQMVWLIDFKEWSISKAIPVKTVQEIAYVLQNHYPERLGIAILYNPPHIFETFWLVSFFLFDRLCHAVLIFLKNHKEGGAFTLRPSTVVLRSQFEVFV